MTLPSAIESSIEIIRPHLVPGAGIAVEVHPKDVDARTVQWLRQAGVTMLSLGIESFDDRVLGILGRGYDSRTAHAAVEAVMDAGFETVNADLMTCIPGQVLKQTVADFEELLGYNVGQVLQLIWTDTLPSILSMFRPISTVFLQVGRLRLCTRF